MGIAQCALCRRLLCNGRQQLNPAQSFPDITASWINGLNRFGGTAARWLLRGPQPVIVIAWSDLKPDGAGACCVPQCPWGRRTRTLLGMVAPGREHGMKRGETL
jgi:hypothetical protein